MNESNSKKNPKKTKKPKVKCVTCEFYNPHLDYCSQKEIEKCTMQAHINFSQCNEYLIRENLIMF